MTIPNPATTMLLCGDARAALSTLSEHSIHCCVTSPPYFGLRDYGVEGQIGLGQTLPEYIGALVEVFRAVRRVLRPDGTLWLNLGDSYASGDRGSYDEDRGKYEGARSHKYRPPTPAGCKAKDLIGTPWRVALALQADGWYLRSEVIWHKPNAMPESATDRPTSSHEHIFLLTPAESYFYDAAATMERAHSNGRVPGNRSREYVNADPMHQRSHKQRPDGAVAYSDRYLRDVWTIATQPYPGEHYATFPEALVEPCVRAGTSLAGVCPLCGAPWRRVWGRGESDTSGGPAGRRDQPGCQTGDHGQRATDHSGAGGYAMGRLRVPTEEFEPGCDHAHEPVPATVLDPFCGTATTGVVAWRERRHFIGIDLDPDAIAQAELRLDFAKRGRRVPAPKPAPKEQGCLWGDE